MQFKLFIRKCKSKHFQLTFEMDKTYLLSRFIPFFEVCNCQKFLLLDQDFIIFRNDGTSCGCHSSLDFTTH